MRNCVVYQGYIGKTGYATNTRMVNGKRLLAHRVAYEQAKGSIPEGYVIDHLCRNRSCVNPDHLEAVTSRENIIRGIGIAAENSRKIRCKYGHAFDLLNTYFYQGKRLCRTCRRRYY